MNKPEPDTSEYQPLEHAFLPNDQIPETLVDLLAHIAVDFVPETIASHDAINAWLDAHDVPVGSECKRYAGDATFAVEGTTVHVKAQPFRFYLLARVQDAVAALPAVEQQAARSLLATCGMGDILDLRLNRRIGRANNLEVWLD